MKIFSMPSRWSPIVLSILFLEMGFISLELELMALFLNDMDWMQTWHNESIAWGLFFLIFHLLAAVIALRLFKQMPLFSIAILGLVLFGGYYAIGSWWYHGLGLSSKMDSPNLEIWEFWRTGGGWLSWLIVVPLLVLYFILRYWERKSKKP